MDNKIIGTTKVAIFRNRKIRKTLYKNEWWFSVIDIVGALTDSDRPRKYWNDLKAKLIKEGYREVSEKNGQLKLEASDGKKYLTDCNVLIKRGEEGYTSMPNGKYLCETCGEENMNELAKNKWHQN